MSTPTSNTSVESIAEATGSQGPQFTDKQKTAYFYKMALSIRPALEFHDSHGLWEFEGEGEASKKGWKNVSEHCLVEAARAGVFATLLRFPPDLQHDSKLAAGVHDFRKKEEVLTIKRGLVAGTAEEKQNIVTGQSGDVLKDSGKFSDRVLWIESASGAQGVLEAESVLDALEEGRLPDNGRNREENLAFLVQHYLDDYAIGAKWVVPAEMVDEGWKNDLNRRLEGNRAKYTQEDEDGRRFYGGRTTSVAQEECSTRIERLLTDEINSVNEKPILDVPQKLPEVVDQEIKRRIASQ